MTREEAIAIIRKEYLCVDRDCDIERSCGRCDLNMPSKEPILKAYKMAIKALEQEPCDKCEVGNPCLYCKHEFSQKIEPMRDFTEEEAKAYSKALDKMYKPTGFNVFDEPCEEIDFVQEHKKIPVTLDLEPCDDAVSRILKRMWNCRGKHTTSIDKVAMEQIIRDELPSVTQKSGKCKNCKYFEYDSVAKVDGIPLIVAHEICNKWGNGCKTREDGYCFLFEPQESEDKE